jgi:hypothetical protein
MATNPLPIASLADDGEPNFTPMVCMELTVKALAAMDAPNPQAKLLVGAELGSQFGACNGMSVAMEAPRTTHRLKPGSACDYATHQPTLSPHLPSRQQLTNHWRRCQRGLVPPRHE